VLVLGLALVYGAIVVTDPWAIHIGGRSTPLLYWSGSGKLVTTHGTYPLYIFFYPSTRSSQLHLDGLRPTGGVQGNGWICTAPAVTQYLELSGTIYGGWRSTEGSVMNFRLLEPNIVDLGGPRRGYFDLYGRWQGPELVMNDRGIPGNTFRSGLRIEHATVTLDWGRRSDFKARCSRATNSESHQ
jgi:hypothetical protein